VFTSVATTLSQLLADSFALTEVDSITSGPRDVIWAPAEIAQRMRAEQSSQLGRDPDQNMPFISFWRTASRPAKLRRSLPMAREGVYTGAANVGLYKMVPVDMVFQCEHWSNVKSEADLESAMRRYFMWAEPPNQLTVMDQNDVYYDLQLKFPVDPTDSSRLMEMFEIGRLHRWTFVVVVQAFAVTGGITFHPIESIGWTVWDYSAYGDIERAVELDSGVITEEEE